MTTKTGSTWIRQDKENGDMRTVTLYDVRIHCEFCYIDFELAIKYATKDHPIENMFAYYYPM